MIERRPPDPPNASRPGQPDSPGWFDLPGRFLDFRHVPPGAVPRHLQRFVLAAIAVVMVGILAVAGPSPKPRPAPQASPTAPVVDPNRQRIEDYERRIEEQAQRLADEQAQLLLVKENAASSPHGGVVMKNDAAPPARAAGSAVPDTRAADNVAYSRPTAARASDAAAAPDTGAPAVPSLTPAALQSLASLLAPAAPLPAPPPSVPPPPAGGSVKPEPPAPASAEPRYVLSEGTVIETVLTNRLDGTFTGPVNCLVSVPAYASDHLVIPAGARVLGEATAVSAFGQSRLAVVFHRLVQPSGVKVNLDQFKGLSQAGDGGLRDHVDRHYFEIFGASLALGAVAGFAQARSPVGYDVNALDAYRQGVATSLSLSSTRVLDRFLNLLPTVTIREGHRIKVYLSSDLALPAYRDALSSTGGHP